MNTYCESLTATLHLQLSLKLLVSVCTDVESSHRVGRGETFVSMGPTADVKLQWVLMCKQQRLCMFLYLSQTP